MSLLPGTVHRETHELRAVSVLTGVRHGEDTGAGMAELAASR